MKVFFRILIPLLVAIPALSATVTNLQAVYRNGQVFVTWDRLLPTSTTYRYTLYKSDTPIGYGYQLQYAKSLGSVRHNSAENVRISSIVGGGSPIYLRIDSASMRLDGTKAFSLRRR